MRSDEKARLLFELRQRLLAGPSFQDAKDTSPAKKARWEEILRNLIEYLDGKRKLLWWGEHE